MGGHFDTERFSSLVAELRGRSVERCLPYPGMTDVPDGYSRFAEEDAMRHDERWDDSCPAYALAVLTHGSYHLPEDDHDMAILWDELGGASTRLWREVTSIVQRGWEWLSHHQAVSGVPG